MLSLYEYLDNVPTGYQGTDEILTAKNDGMAVEGGSGAGNSDRPTFR